MRLLMSIVALGFACLTLLEIWQLPSYHSEWIYLMPFFFSLVSLFHFLRHLNDKALDETKSETSTSSTV